MLCDKCKHIKLPHPQPVSKRHGWTRCPHLCLIRHHASLDDLIIAAEAGCEVCKFFRPFVEYGKSRRRGLAKRSASDCSSSGSIGYSQNDPFEPVDRGRSTSTGGIIYGSESGKRPKHYVGVGKYYEEDSDSDKYCYVEEDQVWTSRGIADHDELVKADEIAYDTDYYNRLAKLGLEADRGSSGGSSNHGSASPGSSRAKANDELKFSLKMYSNRAQKYSDLQWVMTTTDRDMGPDQLWMTVKHHSQSSSFNRSGADNVILVTLSAGSVENGALDDVHSFCVDGVEGYNRFNMAALYPGLWRYRPDHLFLPQRRPRRNQRPILEIYQRRDQTFPTEPPIQSREVLEDPSSEAVMTLARSWLARCVENDELCKLSGHLAMPCRLIDVGDDPECSSVRLHEVSSQEEGLRYATLSHCWGEDTEAITKLRRADRSSMLQEIKLDKLAKNFRDAVHITRGLGLRYLWIDALCIMQDSEEDWAAEAANMGEYYRGSEVTISAFSSPHVQHGILQPRTVLPNPPQIKADGGPLYLRPLLPDTLTITDSEDDSDLRHRVPIQPINRRAWTLQERLFSRRILYFTEDQMVWQCRSRFFGEDGQYTANEQGATARPERDIVDILNYQQRLVGKARKPTRPTITSTHWYALVKAFTQRQLTYHRDRLPALSGLAHEVHRLTGARYVAGLWFNTEYYLKVGLLWETCRERWDGQPRTPARADNTFPSWSWASMDAEIDHPLADSQSIVRQAGLDARFVSVLAPPSSSDPLGAVKSGCLVLDAWHHQYYGNRTYNELCRDAVLYDWASPYGNPASDDPNSPRADPFVTFDVDMPDDLWQPDGWQAHRCFTIVLICYTNDFEEQDDDMKQHATQHFLVLEWGAKQGVSTGWKRVGVAVTQDGTLFKIDEQHRWERQKITIF